MSISLIETMAEVSGSSFIGLDTVTTPKLRGGKSNPMQGRVQKHMTGASVMVFQNKKSHGYDNMVKRRLEKEGKNPESFKLSPRKWGERIENLPVVVHNGKEYLEVIFLHSGKTFYTLDGKQIERDHIEGLEAKPEGHQGSLENKVIIRTFAADSITEIRINGQAFTA